MAPQRYRFRCKAADYGTDDAPLPFPDAPASRVIAIDRSPEWYYRQLTATRLEGAFAFEASLYPTRQTVRMRTRSVYDFASRMGLLRYAQAPHYFRDAARSLGAILYHVPFQRVPVPAYNFISPDHAADWRTRAHWTMDVPPTNRTSLAELVFRAFTHPLLYLGGRLELQIEYDTADPTAGSPARISEISQKTLSLDPTPPAPE